MIYQGKQINLSARVEVRRYMSEKPVVIVGIGGHARSVFSLAVACNRKVLAFCAKHPSESNICGVQICDESQLDQFKSDFEFVIALGDNFRRQELQERLQQRYYNHKFATLIHPSAVIGLNSDIGLGTVIMPGAVVGPFCKIDNGCILNSGCIVDHDCNLGDFVSIAPGATLGGGVSVGARSAVSIGATLKHNICLGKDVIVGAGSNVLNDLPDRVLAFGNPCKVKRDNAPGTKYL